MLVVFATSCDDLAAQKLGFGYVRRGDHIHFEGGGKTGTFGTRIDQPSQYNINGFSRSLRKPLQLCMSPDAATFKALSEEYTRDKNAVYYKWISPSRFLVVALPQADVATFKAINFTHAIDKNTIWYMDRPIKGSDPATIKLIDNRIVKDSRRVYISGEAQGHLDAKTFRKAGSAYYIDANGVYWGSVPIDGADSKTFKVLGDSFVAVDRKSVYRSGQRQPHLDAATCKFIMSDPYGYQVVSDKNGVYLNNLRILHADPADFTMRDKLTATGGKYVFLIDTWHSTPVTVYKEKGRLIAETVLYQKGTSNSLAIIKAEVGAKTLNNTSLFPPPGKDAVGKVQGWQIEIFEREDMIKRMNKAAKLLK